MWASLPGSSRRGGRCAFVIGFLQITQMVSLLRVCSPKKELRTYGLMDALTKRVNKDNGSRLKVGALTRQHARIPMLAT